MTYFPDPVDQLWNHEMVGILGYLNGVGVDIGCGRRTPVPWAITLDKDHPDADLKGDGAVLPFESGSLDWVLSCHSLEHFEDVVGVLTEWTRVLKPLGFLCLIHPDRRGVPLKGSPHADPDHKGEYWHDELAEIALLVPSLHLISKNPIGLILDDGRPWSFRMIFRKQGGNHAESR